MSYSPVETIKTFTVEQANAMLPLVKVIVTDLVQLSQDVAVRQDRIRELESLFWTKSNQGDFSEEILQIKSEIESDTEKLREYVDELLELGVEPKSGPEGLVDFPAVMNGRLVYLCWKLGEEKVSHWHELDAGFAGRQIITSDRLD